MNAHVCLLMQLDPTQKSQTWRVERRRGEEILMMVSLQSMADFWHEMTHVKQLIEFKDDTKTMEELEAEAEFIESSILKAEKERDGKRTTDI